MRLHFTLFLLLFVVTAVSAQTSFPPDVHVKLTLAEAKSVYKIGEPIKLILEFTADREGYEALMLPDRKEAPYDTVVISPEFGVTHWLDDMTGGVQYMRDVISTANLSDVPKRVELILNDTLRFDVPGHYTVSVTTRRVTKHAVLGSRQLTLKTNPITFDVEPMSYTDEAATVKRLSDQLDVSRKWQTDEEVGQQLSYLTGEPSTREKVRRFSKWDERRGNLNAHLWYGLFIAGDRQLVLKLLEAGLRDAGTPASPQLRTAVTMLRKLTGGAKMDTPEPER